ncbi:MAG: hypothetical protein KC503_06700 [Myxococcales bacterium]|nr:hypothetical protein [Myxococcales bacterium]
MQTRAFTLSLLSALLTLTLALEPRLASAQGKAKKAKPTKRAAKKGAARKKTAPRGSVETRLQALSSKLDDLARGVADVPVALKGVQDLMNRVTALSKQLAASKTRQRSYKALRDKTDNFEERIGELELRVAALSLRIARSDAGDGGGNAGFDQGFYIRSSNRKFLLHLGTLLQLGYQGLVYGDSRRYANTDLGQDDSSFVLRRARLRLRGHVYNPRLSYAVELDFGSADPGGPLLVLGGNLRIFRALQLRAGRMKVPFGRGFLVHSSLTQFVERSGVVDAFAHRWDLGVMVHGELLRRRMLSYQLGIFNGANAGDDRDNNTDFLYAARVVFSPLGPVPLDEGDRERGDFRFSLGGSFTFNLAPTDIAARTGLTDPAAVAAARDRDNDGNIDNVGIYSLAIELAARWRGLALQGELYYRVEDPGAVEQGNRTFIGAYGQLSYFFGRANLEIAGRFGGYEDPGYGADRTALRPGEVRELSFVIAGLTLGRLVKWQAEYTHKWLSDIAAPAATTLTTAADLKVHQVRLQLQLAF